ncbi:GNAT family N-acetyltransferase [Phenylobacterium sp.]|uniref:GNAT family N-acetyltransferase n=1 Tax=Phenylobacterium sp. TaxID=1871053 RepID=UPI0035B0E8C5
MTVQIIRPGREHLAGYVAALERGWSADNVRGLLATREELAAIAEDADGFLSRLDDPQAKGGPLKAPDGTLMERLPGYRRWIWDGDFAGSVGFRWSKDGGPLPAHVLGHIGYAVPPWMAGRGYASFALGEVLKDARARGLAFVELTTDPDNAASQRVIEKNGGRMVERFVKPAVYGGGESLRWRIEL